VSCAAEKLSSASLVATKASPQTTEVSAARTMSRTGIAPPPCDGAKQCPAPVRQLRAISRRSELAGAPDLNTRRCRCERTCHPHAGHRSGLSGSIGLMTLHSQSVSSCRRIRGSGLGAGITSPPTPSRASASPETAARRTRHHGRRHSQFDPKAVIPRAQRDRPRWVESRPFANAFWKDVSAPPGRRRRGGLQTHSSCGTVAGVGPSQA
jgi:hypothetical protein